MAEPGRCAAIMNIDRSVNYPGAGIPDYEYGVLFADSKEALEDLVRARNRDDIYIGKMECGMECLAEVADATCAAGDSVSRYGAFAFDSATGAAGFSVWYLNQSSAEERALSECAQHGGQNCAIYRRFPDRCAALVRADDEQGRWARGYGYADSKAAAVDRALSECRNEGVGVCRLEDWACGDDGAAQPGGACDTDAPQVADASDGAPQADAAPQAAQAAGDAPYSYGALAYWI